MSEIQEQLQKAVEFALGIQLASDDSDLTQGKVNTKRLSKISELEAFCFPYFMEIPAYRGGTVAKKIVNHKLDLNMSVNGWRSQLINNFVGATRGVPSVEMAKKPGWIGRNITKTDWKEKAEEEGKIVVE